MADFYISAVRMDSTGQHIESVKTHINKGNSTLDTTGSINSRKFVWELINTKNIQFNVVTWDQKEKKWHIGAKVQTMTNGYITTASNSTICDNLGNLPKF